MPITPCSPGRRCYEPYGIECDGHSAHVRLWWELVTRAFHANMRRFHEDADLLAYAEVQ